MQDDVRLLVMRLSAGLGLLLVGCSAAAASTTEPKDDGARPSAGSDTAGTINSTGTTASKTTSASGDAGDGAAQCSTRAAGFFAGKTIKVGTETRSYDLFVPAGTDLGATLPIIFVFHADDGVSLRDTLGLEAVTGAKAVIVYPYGNDKQWNLGKAEGNDDYAFVDALKASLVTNECADAARTFAFGFSNGAFFTSLLSCYRGASVFRAIVSHSGGLYAPDGVTPTYDGTGNLVCPATPPAALVIHGTADNVVSYSDDGVYARDSWLHNDSCAATTSSFAPSPCALYTTCQKNQVAFCGIPGMGHQLWASAAIATWDFLSRY